MSKRTPPITYRLFEGCEGSAFQLREEFNSSSHRENRSELIRQLSRFLSDKPQIHDLSWSTDDGKTFVVKRKTSDISEVLGDQCAANKQI